MEDISKPVLIEIAEGENFVAYFVNEGTPDHNMRWSGKVLPVIVYSDWTWTYVSNRSSDSESDISNAGVMFEFSYCWRGVWEGRVYPKQREYWGDDIEIMAEVWKRVESMVKDQIKADNPDYDCFDE
jgi:hypothetical protein